MKKYLIFRGIKKAYKLTIYRLIEKLWVKRVILKTKNKTILIINQHQNG